MLLKTERLILRTLTESDTEMLASFEAKNQSHWAAYVSTLNQNSANIDYWAEQIKLFLYEHANNQAVRFIIFEKNQPEKPIIGACNFTQIFRDPFHACYLGYKLDHEYEGKGFMHEALIQAIYYMFNVQNIHRIMANYMPSNQRSERLLDRLGFQKEGYAKDYLLINEKWEDHILTSLTNDTWKPRTGIPRIL